MKREYVFLFDLDGILLDSKGLHTETFFGALKSLAKKDDDREIREAASMIVDMVEFSQANPSDMIVWRSKTEFLIIPESISSRDKLQMLVATASSKHGAEFPTLPFNRFLHRCKLVKDARFVRKTSEHVTPDPALNTLLDQLRKYAVVGIVSNCTADVFEHLLEKMQLESHVDFALGAQDGVPTKPDPSLYHKAIAEAHRQGARKYDPIAEIETPRWFVLEDSESGVLAAKAAGLLRVMQTDCDGARAFVHQFLSTIYSKEK